MAVIKKKAFTGAGLGCVHVYWPPRTVGLYMSVLATVGSWMDMDGLD
jgi:hypothetical protein